MLRGVSPNLPIADVRNVNNMHIHTLLQVSILLRIFARQGQALYSSLASRTVRPPRHLSDRHIQLSLVYC